jgi:hypothetical protein
MLQKLFWWAFTLRVAMCDCHNEKHNEGFVRGKSLYSVTKTGQLPPSMSETSGLALATNQSTFWTHNDGGNPAELYEINLKGEEVNRLKLPKLTNMDWEDLAKDTKGNLYIADVGNNQNQRKDLTIYKINPSQPDNYETIRLNYADQRGFPPTPNERNFDCEATVWYKNKLYLFSKNRSKTNHFVKLYAVPDVAGNYMATVQDSVYSKSMVTAADVSPDGKTLALLTYGKVLLFDVTEDISFIKPTYCIKLAKGQAEAIAFINNTDFVITNERKGEIWRVKKK